MKAPKLLPWYARKAGISIDRAEALWHKAVRAATADTGWVGNSEYWGAAMSNFLRLLDEEQVSLCAPRMSALVRSHNRMWRLPLLALEDTLAALHLRWQQNANCRRRAA